MEDLQKEIEELVIARLNTIPENLQLAVGDKGSFTIKELIRHVRENDDIGKMYVETQLHYLRSLDTLPLDDARISDYQG